MTTPPSYAPRDPKKTSHYLADFRKKQEVYIKVVDLCRSPEFEFVAALIKDLHDKAIADGVIADPARPVATPSISAASPLVQAVLDLAVANGATVEYTNGPPAPLAAQDRLQKVEALRRRHEVNGNGHARGGPPS